ncbi:apyrase-like [Drosophila kikkawai]|uniref:Apyrase-like n=1 Tax=Drosophila kikkawai TaxID=30033 RepID=A0ABM4GPM7_DROKI
MVPWQHELETMSNRIVGQSRVFLQQSECSRGECNLGNFFTDAMLHAFLKDASPSVNDSWSDVSIALTSQGTFRVPIPAGNITYKQLVAMCPWENRLVALNLRGQIILELLEDGVASMNASSSSPRSTRFLQVSGLRVLFDLSAARGQRVTSVRVRCSRCQVPEYRPLDPEEVYRVVVMDYLARGMNGFSLISDNAEDLELGPFDLDALMDYMDSVGIIVAGIENRLQFVKYKT